LGHSNQKLTSPSPATKSGPDRVARGSEVR
jgi:hypothetical protein